jgi:hypothetical protein
MNQILVLDAEAEALGGIDAGISGIYAYPGGLYRALDILSKNNISIEYMYAFAVDEGASVIIRTDVIDEAIKVLPDHKLELKKVNHIYQL